MNLKNIFNCWLKGFPLRALIASSIDFTKLPKSTILEHGQGVVIGQSAVIGERCRLGASISIMNGAVLGNDVLVGTHAVIFSGVTVGDRAKIGAGSLVLKDVPAGVTAVGLWK
jgi:serine O-acetyltransferase